MLSCTHRAVSNPKPLSIQEVQFAPLHAQKRVVKLRVLVLRQKLDYANSLVLQVCFHIRFNIFMLLKFWVTICSLGILGANAFLVF